METCVISMLIGAIIAFLVCIAIQWAVGLVFSQVPMQILRKEHAGNTPVIKGAYRHENCQENS